MHQLLPHRRQLRVNGELGHARRHVAAQFRFHPHLPRTSLLSPSMSLSSVSAFSSSAAMCPLNLRQSVSSTLARATVADSLDRTASVSAFDWGGGGGRGRGAAKTAGPVPESRQLTASSAASSSPTLLALRVSSPLTWAAARSSMGTPRLLAWYAVVVADSLPPLLVRRTGATAAAAAGTRARDAAMPPPAAGLGCGGISLDGDSRPSPIAASLGPSARSTASPSPPSDALGTPAVMNAAEAVEAGAAVVDGMPMLRPGARPAAWSCFSSSLMRLRSMTMV